MRNHIFNLSQYVCSALLLSGALLISTTSAEAQTQVPATAPQVKEVLPSYEGQTVVSIEIAGRPDLDQQRLQPLLVQRAGQPFARAKIDQSISALKSSGKVQEVQLEIRPQADGVRVVLIC
ncbi:MAG: POTRA domain-containing protein, partial [Terriglobales bacterium]